MFYTSVFSRFVELLSFISFFFLFFWRILVRSCLLVAKIRYPPFSWYDPTDLPRKISLAPSASFSFSYFLFSISLISATLTSLRSLSSEISGKIHENLRNYLVSTEHRWVRIFSETFLTGPTRLIIGERIDAWTRPSVAYKRVREAASVCRDFFEPSFSGEVVAHHLPQNRRRKGEWGRTILWYNVL